MTKIHKSKVKYLTFNWTQDYSVRRARKEKSRLESEGYNLTETKQTGLDRFMLKYSKE